MPKIPIVQQQVSPLSTVGRRPPVIRPPIGVGQGARAAASAIGQIGQVTQFIEGKVQQVQISNTQAQVADLQVKADLLLKKKAKDAVSNPLSDPLEDGAWHKEVQDFVTQGLQQIGGDVTTTGARNHFQVKSAEVFSRFTRKIASAREFVSGEKAKAQYTEAQRKTSLDVFDNPHELESLFAQRKTDMAAMVEAGSVTGTDARKILQEEAATYGFSAIQGRANIAAQGGNPVEALTTLRGRVSAGEWDGFLSGGQQKNRILRGLDSAIKTHQGARDTTLSYRLTKPWKYLERLGEAPEPIPTLIGTSDSVIETMTKRQNAIDEAKERHGILNMDFFSPQELELFTQQIDALNGQQQVALFTSLDLSLDSPVKDARNIKTAIGASLFKKDPAMSVAFMNAGESPEDSVFMVRGAKIRQNEGLKLPSFKSTVQPEFDAQLDTSVFDETPEVRNMFAQAIFNHYIAKRASNNENLENFDSSDYLESMETVMGPIMRINGQDTLTFRSQRDEAKGQFVSEDDFQSLLEQLNDDKLEEILGQRPLSLTGDLNFEEARTRLRYKLVGEGRYRMVDPDTGLEVRTQNNEPYVLDMKKIEQALRPVDPVQQRQERRQQAGVGLGRL